MNHDYCLQFDKLFRNFGLGSLLCEPEQIFGGHLHRMYAVTATTGKYAVKALNPQVMLRPEAKQNIINAERIAQIAARYIPALPAKLFDGNCMPKVDSQYYIIFDWIDGCSIFEDQITTSHCELMGCILAKLHKIDFSSLNIKDDSYADEKMMDWQYYLQRGKEVKSEWFPLFEENIEQLINWNKRLIKAAGELSSETVITHCDLDPKNVMWQNEKAVLIDWEAAGIIHPMHDLVITALYWAGEIDTDKDKFLAFIKGYTDAGGILKGDWNAVFNKGFGSKLGWLEYSLKRSLGIECADEAEQKIGTDHVFGMIKRLHNYNDTSKWIIELLESNK